MLPCDAPGYVGPRVLVNPWTRGCMRGLWELLSFWEGGFFSAARHPRAIWSAGGPGPMALFHGCRTKFLGPGAPVDRSLDPVSARCPNDRRLGRTSIAWGLPSLLRQPTACRNFLHVRSRVPAAEYRRTASWRAWEGLRVAMAVPWHTPPRHGACWPSFVWASKPFACRGGLPLSSGGATGAQAWSRAAARDLGADGFRSILPAGAGQAPVRLCWSFVQRAASRNVSVGERKRRMGEGAERGARCAGGADKNPAYTEAGSWARQALEDDMFRSRALPER